MKFFTVGLVALAEAVGPVQKVLQLLTDIKGKVQAEGEVEAEQFDKYRKWCAEEEDTKEDAISDNAGRIETLSATIEQLTGAVAADDSEIGEVAAALSASENDLKQATSVRTREHNDFSAADKELAETIDMLVRAKSVLKRGVALTQTAKAPTQAITDALSAVLNAAKIDAADRQKLASLVQASTAEDDDAPDFLARAAPEAKAYESHSSSILQVLDDLREKAEDELDSLRKEEVNARHAFEMVKQSLENEMKQGNEHLSEVKRDRASKSEANGTAKRELSSASNTKKADEKYLSELQQMCRSKGSAFESRAAERSEELKALAEAISTLSEDGAAGAISRQLPGEALVQVAEQDTERRHKAARVLIQASKKFESTMLAQLANRFRDSSDPFEKVRGMIEQMISRLMAEANNDASHKEWCDTETAKSTKLREKHSSRREELAARQDKATSAVNQLKMEVASLRKQLSELATASAEAAAQRTSEHKEFEAAMADHKAGQEALQHAIQVLKEYYSKSFVQIKAHQPSFGGPIFEDTYEKKGDSANGVIGLLEVAQSDLARLEAEGRADEEQAARAYDKFVQDSRVNKATMETDVRNKESEITRMSTMAEELKADVEATDKELSAVMTYLEKLRESCVVKPMSYAERKARRENEIQALHEALDILAGDA